MSSSSLEDRDATDYSKTDGKSSRKRFASASKARSDSDEEVFDDVNSYDGDAEVSPQKTEKRRGRKSKTMEKPKSLDVGVHTRVSPNKRLTRSTSKSDQEKQQELLKDYEEATDFEPDDDDEELERTPTSASKTKRSPEKQTCPHCGKAVSTIQGLQYHLEYYVCRIEECPDPAIVARSKRKRGKSKKGEQNKKRFRGSISERTCPLCDRVFTSNLGMNYHFKHKVCQQTAKNPDEKLPPFHALQPGERFVTQYGVVEVVKDDRATPLATAPPNIKALVRAWQCSKGSYEAQRRRALDSTAMLLRYRRSKINAQYENQNVTQASVFRAYFDGHPRHKNKNRLPLPKDPPKDPMAPADSFPDRIVECLWLPDKRDRYEGSCKNPTEIKEDCPDARFRTRLFLQRKFLTEPYQEEISTYACVDCGQRFASLTGQRYHTSNNVCTQRSVSEGAKRKEREVAIDIGAEFIRQGNPLGLRFYEPPLKPRPQQHDTRKNRKRIRKKKEMGIYPEVLLFLGFKLIKEDMKFTEDMKLPNAGEHVSDDKLEDETVKGDLSVHKPQALLSHLKKKLVEHVRGADDQKYGSMYSEVYKALGYEKVKKRKVKNKNEVGTSKRRKRDAKPPPPPKPLPPIIDTRTLADEVDSGRYPSIKRYKGDEHEDVCVLCKDGGNLVCCDFCTKAEHMRCIRTKFRVKDPEPEDDFMCHKCIQYILQRRSRAERRRLEKQARDRKRREQEALEETRRNPDIKRGSEYQFLAARGQEVSELVELLQDAQDRLKQSLATAKMNNVRRKIMGCFYTKNL